MPKKQTKKTGERKLKQGTPERLTRDITIAQQRSAGQTPEQIAKNVGLSKRSVYRVLEQDGSKKILDKVYQRYILAAPGIAKRFIKLCYSDDEAIASRNISKFHDMIGMMPSHTQSVFIQQIFNTQVNAIPDDVHKLIDKYADDQYTIDIDDIGD